LHSKDAKSEAAVGPPELRAVVGVSSLHRPGWRCRFANPKAFPERGSQQTSAAVVMLICSAGIPIFAGTLLHQRRQQSGRDFEDEKRGKVGNAAGALTPCPSQFWPLLY